MTPHVLNVKPIALIYDRKILIYFRVYFNNNLQIYLFVFNYRSQYDNLCYCLGNQIVFVCRKTINLTTVLDSDVDLILYLIHECLQCCEMFIQVFNEVIISYSIQDSLC